jgi:hypothetical protein
LIQWFLICGRTFLPAKIRDWELEELISVPEQVGLAFLAGTDYYSEAFCVGACKRDRCLKESALFGFHAEVQIRIRAWF